METSYLFTNEMAVCYRQLLMGCQWLLQRMEVLLTFTRYIIYSSFEVESVQYVLDLNHSISLASEKVKLKSCDADLAGPFQWTLGRSTQ